MRQIKVYRREMGHLLACTLTLVQIILFHGADKVRSGIKVVGPRLLEAPQAEEAPLVSGTAGKGSPAGDAGVARPALHLQVKGLQRRDGHLPLATTWRNSTHGGAGCVT